MIWYRANNLKAGMNDGSQVPQMLPSIQLVPHPHQKFFGKNGQSHRAAVGSQEEPSWMCHGRYLDSHPGLDPWIRTSIFLHGVPYPIEQRPGLLRSQSGILAGQFSTHPL